MLTPPRWLALLNATRTFWVHEGVPRGFGALLGARGTSTPLVTQPFSNQAHPSASTPLPVPLPLRLFFESLVFLQLQAYRTVLEIVAVPGVIDKIEGVGVGLERGIEGPENLPHKFSRGTVTGAPGQSP